MPIAVYPGSFDPITLGHIDIIRRIQKMFGEVTVVISQSPRKSYLFSADERKALVMASLKDHSGKSLKGVTVDVYDGLTVDYVKKVGARVIIRGLRAVTDFEYEFVMANMNRKLAPNIETMIVFASPEFYYISSSTLKEVAIHGGSVKDMVPPAVNEALKDKFKSKKKAK